MDDRALRRESPEGLWLEPDASRLSLDLHRVWLADRVRTERLMQAVSRHARPASVVVDLGAGTGLVAIAAARAGARRVIAIESSGIARFGRAISRGAGETAIEWIQQDSRRVVLDEPADVIAFDYFGDLGLTPEHVLLLSDARRRWLRPGGILIPSAIDMLVAVVADGPTGHDEVFPSCDLSCAARLTSIERLCRISSATMEPGPLVSACTLEVASGGRARGLGAFFRAWLTDALSVSNAPDDPAPSTRPHAFVPFADPVDLCAGDCVEVRVQANTLARTLRFVVTWHPRVGAARTIADQSNLSALMAEADSHRPAAPGAASPPRLSADGRRALSVLRGISAGRSVAEIGAALAAESHAFATRAAADAFVARVARRARRA